MAHPAAPARPVWHLAPPRGWMNDPNGLCRVGGRWHTFYQHHPESDEWGPMHWGHASSTDLAHWEHHPVALAPDEHGTIFSGSVVCDHDDTAGFGADALVALFTHHAGDCSTSRWPTAWTGASVAHVPRQPCHARHRGRLSRSEGAPTAGWSLVDGAHAGRPPRVLRIERPAALASNGRLRPRPRLRARPRAGRWECPDLVECRSDDGARRGC